MSVCLMSVNQLYNNQRLTKLFPLLENSSPEEINQGLFETVFCGKRGLKVAHRDGERGHEAQLPEGRHTADDQDAARGRGRRHFLGPGKFRLNM